MRNIFIPLCVFTLLTACSEKHAGGPSSVETQNSIAGIFTLPDGTPAAQAKVALFHADEQSSAPIASTITDSKGAFTFDVPDSNLYSVVATDNENRSARILQQGKNEHSSNVPFSLAARPHLHVGLMTNAFGAHANVQLGILGTDIHLPWNTDTLISVTPPGPGTYIFTLSLNAEQREVAVTVNESSDTIWLNPNATPRFDLMNFEHSCNQSNLGLLLGESWNFVISGSGNTQGPALNFMDLCTSDADHGQVAHASLSTSDMDPWLVLGTVFGDETKGVNLSSMDSLVFWARGTCSFSVGFITHDMIKLADYEYAKSPLLNLTEGWSRYTIPANDFQYPQSSDAAKLGLTWENSATRVHFLQWDISGTCDFWLDDVQLVGSTYPDLKITP